MATCKKCGVQVGCGCQLVNGLCKGCYAVSLQTTKRMINYVNTKINRLSSLFNNTSVNC